MGMGDRRLNNMMPEETHMEDTGGFPAKERYADCLSAKGQYTGCMPAKEQQAALYGAGMVAVSVYYAIKELYKNCRIINFIVSERKGNPEEIDGVPVITLQEFNRTDVKILVTAPENHHAVIAEELEQRNLGNYVCIDSKMEAGLMERYYDRMNHSGNFPMFPILHSYTKGLERISLQVYMAKFYKDKPLQREYEIPEWIRTIQAGAALTDIHISDIRDDTGDNISAKNGNYSELSAMYWVGKHGTCGAVGGDGVPGRSGAASGNGAPGKNGAPGRNGAAVGNGAASGNGAPGRNRAASGNGAPGRSRAASGNGAPGRNRAASGNGAANGNEAESGYETKDYLGLFHYRRILDVTEEDLYRIKNHDIDVILPYPTIHYPSADEHHKRYLRASDWETMVQSVKEISPEYAKKLEEIFSQPYFYNYNMFIARKHIFKEYCDWVFPILERTEELSTPKGCERADRYIGYLGESLTTLFFMYHRNDYRMAHTGRIMLV